jgi:hypothetical protein
LIVNRYILKDFWVSDLDILSLQNFAKMLPAVDYFDKMQSAAMVELFQ